MFDSKHIWSGLILSAVLGAPVGYIVGSRGTLGTVPTPEIVAADPNTKNVVIGELTPLASVGDYTAWASEPEVTDIVTYGEKNQNAVVSFRATGRYVIFKATAQEGKVIVSKTVFKVSGGAVAPTSDWASKFNSWGIPDRAQASSLAASFETVAKNVEAKLAQNILVTPEDVLAQTKAENTKALGANVAKWRPFFDKLNGELAARAEAGSLVSMKDHINTWKEIAEALRG